MRTLRVSSRLPKLIPPLGGALCALSLLVAGSPSASAFPIYAELRLRERVPIESLAEKVSQATRQGIFLRYRPEEIRRIAGPDEREYQRLLGALRARGFRITEESPTRLGLEISADSALYERVFEVTITDLGGGTHRSSGQPRFPGDLSLIASLSGLDNTHQMRPLLRSLPGPPPEAPANSGQGTGQGTAGPGTSAGTSDGFLTASQIHAAYGFDGLYQKGLSGNGQEIAIATHSDFPGTPYASYFRRMKLGMIPRIRKIQVGFVPDVSLMDAKQQEKSGVSETEMDIEYSGMIAPGATISVYEAENSEAGTNHLFRRILDDDRAKIVTYSWGQCEALTSESELIDETHLLARAVAQGVNVFVATGDQGWNDCGNGSLAVDFPASSPYVIATGGTTVREIHPFLEESGWSQSGGGISGIFESPPWQAGLPGEYRSGRAIPDVAFAADPKTNGELAHFNIGEQSFWMIDAGTSAAAPQWAGFLALVNEGREKHGKTTLGYLNPLIYGMSDGDRANTFNDVTTGSNGAYSAGPGWDAVTGWGSMKASALYSWLVRQ